MIRCGSECQVIAAFMCDRVSGSASSVVRLQLRLTLLVFLVLQGPYSIVKSCAQRWQCARLRVY